MKKPFNYFVAALAGGMASGAVIALAKYLIFRATFRNLLQEAEGNDYDEDEEEEIRAGEDFDTQSEEALAAFRKGLVSGTSSGYRAGYSEGKERGNEEGLLSGYPEGFAAGYRARCDEENDEYAAGYEDGMFGATYPVEEGTDTEPGGLTLDQINERPVTGAKTEETEETDEPGEGLPVVSPETNEQQAP